MILENFRTIYEIFHIKLTGKLDKNRILKRYPELCKSSNVTKKACEILFLPYKDYKKNISSGGSSISLQLAIFLYVTSEMKRAKRILDLGSGFSSYTFRLYKSNKNKDIEIYSVDSDSSWLEKTKEYLKENNLDFSNLYTWEDFKTLSKPKFDIIFVDIRPIIRRVKHFKHFVSYLSKDGVIIYDDYQKLHLRKPIRKIIRKQKRMFDIYNLYELTSDSYGRFSLWIENKKVHNLR